MQRFQKKTFSSIRLSPGLIVLVLCTVVACASVFAYHAITKTFEEKVINGVHIFSTFFTADELLAFQDFAQGAGGGEHLELTQRVSSTVSVIPAVKSAFLYSIESGTIHPLEVGQPFHSFPDGTFSSQLVGGPIITKPYSDSFGTWTTVLVPISSIPTGLGLGLTFRTRDFYSLARLRTAEITAALCIVFLLVLFMVGILKNSRRARVEQQKAQEASEHFQLLQRRDNEEKKLMETTLRSLGEGVITTDTEARVVSMNRLAEKMTGWSIQDAKGRELRDIFHIVDGLTLEACEPWAYAVLRTGLPKEYNNTEVRLIDKGGKLLSIEDNVSPILDDDGKILGVVIIFIDGTEKRSQLSKLHYVSTHDALTGLLNRQSFYARVQELDWSTNYPLILMLLDINGLKLINEAYGHATGDSLLTEIAIILQRPWHPGQLVARVDGDEFAILFTNSDEQVAERVIIQIQEALSEQSFLWYGLSISIGYAKKEYVQMSIGELHKRAEDTLLSNKVVESQGARLKMIDLLLQSLFRKSSREMEHSKRVASLATRFGMKLGLSEKEIQDLSTVAVMHDIGKIAISDKVLNKKGALSGQEWNEIFRHPEIGFNILSSVTLYAPMAEQVLCHHERWDGTGYPNKLAGQQIPFNSRILGLCDAFDAMTSQRTYRSGVSLQEAMQEIVRCSNTQFDPELAPLFVEMIAEESIHYPETVQEG